MKKVHKAAQWIRNFSMIVESIIAFLLIVAMVILLVRHLFDLDLLLNLNNQFRFDEFFSVILNVIVGVEFARMLCTHTPESVIDVLLFAIARQLLLAHTGMWELLAGTVAIAVLLAVRKFLIPNVTVKRTEEPNITVKRTEEPNLTYINVGQGES